MTCMLSASITMEKSEPYRFPRRRSNQFLSMVRNHRSMIFTPGRCFHKQGMLGCLAPVCLHWLTWRCQTDQTASGSRATDINSYSCLFGGFCTDQCPTAVSHISDFQIFQKHTIYMQIHNMNQNIVVSVGSDQGNIKKKVQCVISGHGEISVQYIFIILWNIQKSVKNWRGGGGHVVVFK